MLGNLFTKTEQRAISFQSIWGAGDSLAFTTAAGTNIDENTAMQINAFYACVLLISDTISTLPMDAFRRNDGVRIPYRPRPEWVVRPDFELSRAEHFQQVLVSLLLDGNAFVRVFRDNRGDIINLVVLDPQKVEVTRDPVTRELAYRYELEKGILLSQAEVMHLTEIRKPGDSRGLSRVTQLKENLGLSSALQEFASRFFGAGANLGGYIEHPAQLTKEQSQDLADAWRGQHKGLRKSHKVGVLSGGAKFTKTAAAPDEAQMLESRKLAIEEIARIFRVPPHMIGITTPGAMSYASVEQNNINFVTHTLRPYITKIEEHYSRLLPSDAFLRINVDGLLRGDFATRMQGYSIGSQAGFLSINDIRKFEDMTPVDSGDVYRVPLANVNLAAADLVETDKKVAMAQKLVISGFDPESVLKALDLPTIKHTGVPSTQLQPVAQIDPQSPQTVYDVNQRDVNVNMPEILVNVPPAQVSVAPPIINIPETVVNVNIPEQKTLIRTVERDKDNRVSRIIEERSDK
jgi:HK97 family phage portal protein